MRSVEPSDPALTYAVVLDALPIVAWMARPDGTISYVSKGWTAFTGIAASTVLGVGYQVVIDPADLARVVRVWERARASEAAYRDEYRLRIADGSYRWVLSQAAPMCDGPGGRVVGWFGTLTDIEDRRRSEEALAASEATHRAISGTIPGVTWAAAPSGELIHVGDQWIAVHGKPRDGALGEAWLESVHPDDREEVLAVWARALASGDDYDTEFRVRLADGTYHWFLVRALPVRDDTGAIVRWVGVNIDIEERRRAEDERDRVESGLRLLSLTGAAALDSLDYAATLRNIARAFVEEFASYCIVDVFSAEGGWERTIVHREPARAELIRSLPQPAGDHPIARALRDGVSSVVAVGEGWAQTVGGGERRDEVVRELGVRSFISVPILTPGLEVIGALSCALDATATRRAYVPEDVPFVEEVGRRAGAAVANARLYERERRIAVELQAASLPAALPQIGPLDLDAEYRPGSAEATIGGDWYDAFALEDGRVAITVGDVLGHGLHAAVTMTKLRQAMQSAAMIEPDPNVMLDVADKTLRLLDPDGYATALAAVYDGVAGRLIFASAGHPGPLLRTRDGQITEFGSPGLLLGLREPNQRQTVVIPAAAGSAIVFYTDGLVEATRDIAEGQRRLRAAVGRDDIVLGPRPARGIVRDVLAGTEATDDVAVLVARIAGLTPS